TADRRAGGLGEPVAATWQLDLKLHGLDDPILVHGFQQRQLVRTQLAAVLEKANAPARGVGVRRRGREIAIWLDLELTLHGGVADDARAAHIVRKADADRHRLEHGLHPLSSRE